KKKSPPPQFNRPSKDTQVSKFESNLTNLSVVLQNQTAQIFPSIRGLTPEMVLVFEIAGTIDEFFKAVVKTPGMEFLNQYKSEFDPTADFFYADKPDKKIESRIFLTMSNQQGITELLSYWRSWKEQRKLKHGIGKFKDLFNQLKDIRFYNVHDRFKDTGFENYVNEQLQLGSSNINFEIEFAYSSSQQKQQRIVTELSNILALYGGSIIQNSECIINDIFYHGLIANAPITVFNDLTENTSITFLKFNWILYFRPVGQTISKPQIDSSTSYQTLSTTKPLPSISEPAIALLDGLPLANHQLLADRLIIDDPDNFSGSYQANNRIHGTLMSSLIVHGDLGDTEEPLIRKIYVRPVMIPYQGFYGFEEQIPVNKLPIDIIHSAIKRIVDRPELNSIKIINLSICDPFQPYLNSVSTLGKLLDWLAYKYNLLFIVSAGNYTENLEIDVNPAVFAGLSSAQKQTAILKSLLESQFNRKILSPAESVNALSIGAIYDDSSNVPALGNRLEPYTARVLPSCISRIGYGINRSLKPDICFKGGRTLYRVKQTISPGAKTELTVVPNVLTVPPGNITAVPGSSGSLNATGYSAGTSNATALITRQAARLYEVLESINYENESILIPKEYYSVLIKTLLAHYSATSDSWGLLERELSSFSTVPPQVRKYYLNQCLGYGTVNIFLLGYCTDYRVTLLGFGELKADDAHVYSFPLPNALSGKPINKKLIISLAWFSPINFKSGKYRQAALTFDNIQSNDDFDLGRTGSDVHHSKRGTLQHDILESHHADAYIDGSNLSIKINCRENASGLGKQKTKYAIAVTLEVDESHGIPIYEEIKNRISQQIQVTTN
ncbi:MAG: hypothetical protein A2309_13185, partial [Bacteroidetes bacterium RIFOXYB2_FULL_35_7]